MPGSADLNALMGWYLASGLAAIIYLAIGQPPVRTRMLAVAVGVLLTTVAMFALRDVPFGTGTYRFLVFIGIAAIPPCSFGLGWLLFRQPSR